MLLKRLGREGNGAVEGARQPVDRLSDRLRPFPADGAAGMDADRAPPSQRFCRRLGPPGDRQTPRGAIADPADVAEERPGVGRSLVAIGRLAGGTGGEEFEREIPERTVGNDHELLDPLRQFDLRLLEEEALDGDCGGTPVGGHNPVGAHRHMRIEQTQRLGQLRQFPRQRRRLADLPGGDTVTGLKRPPRARA